MITFIADVHVGNHRRYGGELRAGLNERCRIAIDCLDRAVTRSLALGSRCLVILGDLYDTEAPSPQVIAAVQEVLRGLPVLLLMGNHDMVSTLAGDHALGPLNPVADVVEKSELRRIPCGAGVPPVELVLVPFQPGPAEEWLEGALPPEVEKAPEGPRILCLHLGLRDEQTPAYLAGSDDSISVTSVRLLMDRYQIRHTLAGNWHQRKSWVHTMQPNGRVLQVGSLCPTGYDNPGLSMYGTLAFFDGIALDWEELPGPRFFDAMVESKGLSFPEWKQKLQREHSPEEGWRLYPRVEGQEPEALAEWRAGIEMLAAAGVVAGGDVRMSERAQRHAARYAATVASSASSIEEAVRAYLLEVPLPEGVNRDAVQARVRQYLAKATP